jgi:hypothetical protein
MGTSFAAAQPPAIDDSARIGEARPGGLEPARHEVAGTVSTVWSMPIVNVA